MSEISRRVLLQLLLKTQIAGNILPMAGAPALQPEHSSQNQRRDPATLLQAGRFRHPGILQTSPDLAFMKAKVAGNKDPWKAAYGKLLLQPGSEMGFAPKAFTYVRRGGYGRGSIGGFELLESADAALSHALQWSITGRQEHADKVIEILDAWSGTLWELQGNDAKLIVGWVGGLFCHAAEIVRYSNAGWKPDSIEQLKQLLLTVFVPLLKDFFPEANGNWDGAIIFTLLSIGVFCDDRPLFQRAVDHFAWGAGNGGITKYVYPSGQCEENARDQGHTQLGLKYFALAAQVALNQGVNLFELADNRLAIGYEYTSRYMFGENVAAYGELSKKGRGHFDDAYEAAYQYYAVAKHINLPWTARAVEQARQGGKAWRSLMFYRGPSLLADVKHNASLELSPYAPHAGAQETAPAPSATSIKIAPGQSIQNALELCVRQGLHEVGLAEGVHTLEETLRMPSGVTLSGQGKETILLLDPKAIPAQELAMVNGDDDMHDVVLRDFIIEGAVTTTTSSDPNQDRRVRSSQMAPSRGGIRFTGKRPGAMRNIRLENLTVRHCTRTGVMIDGAANVTIVACDFSDNGGAVAPGPGQHHNLFLSHISACEVRDSRLDDSSFGSGLDALFAERITVTNCETARNHLHGIALAESQSAQIEHNLAEGNDGAGIGIERLMEGCRDLKIPRNLCRNNGREGISIVGAQHVVMAGNTVVENRPAARCGPEDQA